MLFLPHSKFVVQCRNVKSGFEHSQVRKHRQISYAGIFSDCSLKIDTHKCHIIFHASSLMFFFIAFSK